MAIIKIAVINRTSNLPDDEAIKVVAALQKQVHRDFAPAWGVDASLGYVARGENPPPGLWWLVLLDDSDVAAALGYHDTTNEGLPMGKVFVETCRKYKLDWACTASHELLEQLGDPWINLLVEGPRTNRHSGAVFYSYEDCDAVESEEYGYKIDGVLVSDFVYPSWFGGAIPPYDFQKVCTKPFQLMPGGYIGTWEPGKGWGQIDAAHVPGDVVPMRYLATARPARGSRRERRVVGHDRWYRSVAV